MSGICGVFRLDGGPVDAADLRAMMVQLERLGPDGGNAWYEGSVGLGHRLFHNTPESVNETLPLVSADGCLVMTACARLDNRDDLFRLLAVPSAERADLPDGALILKAYEKWGEDCPPHLLGDWSFAVWDAREGKLFLARDQYGQTELVYHHSGEVFAFASSIGALLALPDVPRKPHEREVGRLLACLGKYSENTYYDGIRFLCVAQALTVTPQRLHLRRYWHPENTPDLRLKSDRDYVEAFLEVYTTAVRCRLRSHDPVCATLSGGLDSGSVAGLAARALADNGKRLPAFTWVSSRDTPGGEDARFFADELPYAEATARESGNIDVFPIETDAISPIASIRRMLDDTGEPRLNVNASSLFVTLDEAAARGMGTLLIGQGGNFTVSIDGRAAYRAQLVGTRQWRKLWSEAASWRLLRGCTLPQALMSQFVRPLIPAPALIRYLSFKQGDLQAQSSAINPELENRIRPFLNDMRREQSVAGLMRTRHGWWDSILWRQGRRWPPCGRQGRVEVRDPTFDPRIVEFCLSVPPEQWARGAEDRWLIRRAMAGFLPDRVVRNRKRGRQSLDYASHLREDMAAAQEVLRELEQSTHARQFVDLRKMRTLIGELHEKGAAAPTVLTKSLHRGLTVGMYLLRFDR